MNLIWTRSPIASSEVVDIISEKTKWQPRTIRTLLDRLVKKRALKMTFDGKRNIYEPLLKMEDCVRQESQSFLKRVFSGEPASMLLHLVKETELSEEEIKKLKKILSDKAK